MRILIIGGTRFLGRHLVEAALAHRHDVTLFNRGKSNPGLFPHVETIIGDRESDLDPLRGRIWEAVVDTSGFVPRIVRLSAEVLAANVTRYVFISSVSVYENFRKIGIDETYPLGKIPNETTEEVTGETYGPLKALCEQAVQGVYGLERTVIVRPGLISGPYDPTDRFTYWPVRVRRGGDMLAPQSPGAVIQLIDARDLSEFIVKLVEEDAWGTYNATGPDYELTLGRLLEVSQQVSGSHVNVHWASLDFLNQHKVEAWSDMPAWIPDDEEGKGFSHVDASKAIQAGLKFRPLEETVRDTLEWARTLPPDHEWQAGLSAGREKELLALLKE
jgi:2'-hydroxyisoflavone reductase